MFQMVKKQLM